MNRDPYHAKILAGLQDVGDKDLFEHCVVELLRPEHPTLIPVPGGNDAGTDGAFIDDDEQGILITTTQQDVISNVTKSLKSHAKAGCKRKLVLVATSQLLNPLKCRNIEKRVEKLGFKLAHHPYTRDAIAERLYHKPRWCKELLGITGRPSALGRIPLVVRPFRDLPLIGRDEDLTWLRSTEGDRLVYGQPGVGKSFLEQALVNEGLALFALDNDIERLSDAIRDQQPSSIVIEDAHLRLTTIHELRRFRAESDATFDIIADCWPGSADSVMNTLSLNEDQCRQLFPLPAELIVKLLRAAGIFGPDWVVDDLVRQSVGCPGRAAMLAQACLTGGVRDVWRGETIANAVTTLFGELLDKKAVQMLAGFAIGGTKGMHIDTVSQNLGYPRGDVQHCMAQLAMGGVVYDAGGSIVAVIPESLRCALVKKHFFEDVPLPLDDYLDCAVDYGAALESLVGAKSRGAEISPSELLGRLERVPNSAAWESFAWSSQEAAELILRRKPEKIKVIPRALLHRASQLTLPKLMQMAIGDVRAEAQTPGHPLRLIAEWVGSGNPDSDDLLRRRTTLLQVATHWLKEGSDQRVGFRVLGAAVSPGFEDRLPVPGKRNSIVMRGGLLALNELCQVAALWPVALKSMRSQQIIEWGLVLGMVDPWVYPGRGPVDPPSESVKFTREIACRMLRDVADVGKAHSGFLAQLQCRASDLGIELDVEPSPHFTVLFPCERRSEDWDARSKEQHAAAVRLAQQWSEESPQKVAAELARCAGEAEDVGISYPDHSPTVCQHIAENCERALPWVEAFLDAALETKHVLPFLEKARANGESEWVERAVICLNTDSLVGAGLSILLTVSDLPENVEPQVVERTKLLPSLVQHLCFQGAVPTDRLAVLLESEERDIAEPVAIGIWLRPPEEEVPSDLAVAWTRAVIHHVHDRHHLIAMLQANPELASEWLMDRAQHQSSEYHYKDSVIEAAAGALARGQKKLILGAVGDVFDAGRIVRYLVGDDRDLYRELLSDDKRKHLHLAPLSGVPDDSWAELALLAMEAGHPPDDVASSAHREIESFHGPLSGKYAQEAIEWEVLRSHTDHRIKELARIGYQAAMSEFERWRKCEAREEFVESYV